MDQDLPYMDDTSLARVVRYVNLRHLMGYLAKQPDRIDTVLLGTRQAPLLTGDIAALLAEHAQQAQRIDDLEALLSTARDTTMEEAAARLDQLLVQTAAGKYSPGSPRCMITIADCAGIIRAGTTPTPPVAGADPAQTATDERSQARQESRLLLDDDRWLVLMPLTEKAAQFYSRGTSWAISWGDPKGSHPTRNCHFDEYMKDGSLIIAVNKADDEERYLFHASVRPSFQDSDYVIGIADLRELIKSHPVLFTVLLPHLPVVGVLGDESQQMAAVRQDGHAIRYIRNPSEIMQLAAVGQNGMAIQHIQDPTEAVQRTAVSCNGSAISCIKDPSEAVQLAAVRQRAEAIWHLRKSSEIVQLAAVRQDGRVIRHILNPSEIVQLAAVRHHPEAIQHIRNPSEIVKLAAGLGWLDPHRPGEPLDAGVTGWHWLQHEDSDPRPFEWDGDFQSWWMGGDSSGGRYRRNACDVGKKYRYLGPCLRQASAEDMVRQHAALSQSRGERDGGAE